MNLFTACLVGLLIGVLFLSIPLHTIILDKQNALSDIQIESLIVYIIFFLIISVPIYAYYADRIISNFSYFKDKFLLKCILTLICLTPGIAYYAPVYINQYNVSTPTEHIIAMVTEKTVTNPLISSRHSRTTYTTRIVIDDKQSITVQNKYLYNTVNDEDKVLLTIQKGRLGYYFVTGLYVINKNFQMNL